MEIWHRFTFKGSALVDASIRDLRLKFERSPLFEGESLIHLDITESDPRWDSVRALSQQQLARTGYVLDISDTVFNLDEIAAADWIRAIPVFQQDYPQPKEGWEGVVYEKKCPQCGVGYRQIAPFRIKSEPRLGKQDFVSLFWGHAVFCTGAVLDGLRDTAARGYEVWRVLIHRTDEPSRLVSQLMFERVAKPGLAQRDKSQPEVCPQCGITKYAYHREGYMQIKRQALNWDVDFQLTDEWFGSGSRTGFREVLVSKRVAKLIIDRGWRGICLKPVELS